MLNNSHQIAVRQLLYFRSRCQIRRTFPAAAIRPVTDATVGCKKSAPFKRSRRCSGLAGPGPSLPMQ